MSFNIKFDYRFDTEGFFNDPERRIVLEQAAQIWSYYIQDEFTDILPGEEVSPNITSIIERTEDGFLTSTSSETIVLDEPIDDLLIFVYSLDLQGVSNLAVAQSSGRWIVGSERDIRYNGSDFEPWIGSIYFNSSKDFFFDSSYSTEELSFNQSDFLSVALHEIGHLLGIGSSEAYNNFVINQQFTGENAVALNNGQPIPLTEDNHIEEGFSTDTIPEVLLDPSITNGTRIFPTPLELAILSDIGYEIENQDTIPPSFILNPSTVNLSINATNIREGNPSTVTITATADSAVNGDQTLNLVLSSTASENDFVGDIPSSIIIPDGETTTSLTLTIANDDLVEPQETATFTINNPSDGLIIGDSSQVSLTITDNDDEGEIILDAPLFRFRNEDVFGTYLFAGQEESQNVRDNFSPPFIEEGIAFNVSLEENDDLIRFNRFSNNQVQGTYLYATEAESINIRENFSDIFTEEGIAFYSYGAEANSGQDVVRFRNKNVAGTYLFVLIEEAESIRENFSDVFIEEGVAFEVIV